MVSPGREAYSFAKTSIVVSYLGNSIVYFLAGIRVFRELEVHRQIVVITRKSVSELLDLTWEVDLGRTVY